MAEIDWTHQTHLTLPSLLIIVLVFWWVHNRSADTSIFEDTWVRDRPVIIWTSFQLLYVAHALDVKDYFFSIFIRLLPFTAHASVQPVVLHVLFELFASIFVIDAAVLLRQSGHLYELRVLMLIPASSTWWFIQHWGMRVKHPVRLYWRQVREISLEWILLIELPSRRVTLIFENWVWLYYPRCTTNEYPLLSELEIGMRSVIIALASASLVQFPTSSLRKQYLIPALRIASAAILCGGWFNNWVMSRRCDCLCPLFIHY
jgi:hypothetical protein